VLVDHNSDRMQAIFRLLEGCSPLQPREPNTAPLDSAAPRDRAPSRADQDFE